VKKASVLVIGLVLGLAFLAVALPPYPPPNITAQVTRVIDGDTVELRVQDMQDVSVIGLKEGELVKMCYIGIDTPETVHPTKPVEEFGKEASAMNGSLVSGKQVFLELDVQHWDQYDRLLAYVYLDEEGCVMVNAILVAVGFAYSSPYPPNVRYEHVFRALAHTARDLGLGLWYSEDGDGNGNGGEPLPCNCTGPDLDCGDFSTHAEAQACYEYCIEKGYKDIFRFDGDNDGEACEALP